MAWLLPFDIFSFKRHMLDISPIHWKLCVYFRYVLKVTISRGYGGSIVEYQDFVVKFISYFPTKTFTTMECLLSFNDMNSCPCFF